jgi:hypothetical protein
MTMFSLGWFGFFKCDKYNLARVRSHVWTWEKIAAECDDPATFPQWKHGSPINFRAMPYWFDWALLLLMSILNQVNFFFLDSKETLQLEQDAYEAIRDGNSTGAVASILIKGRNFTKRYIKFLVLYIMCLANIEA